MRPVFAEQLRGLCTAPGTWASALHCASWRLSLITQLQKVIQAGRYGGTARSSMGSITLVFLAIEAAVSCWDGAHMWSCMFYLQNTLEQCSVCAKPIMERILRATGKAYHPHCFTCVMCHRSLDGIPFTVDAGGNIHCIEDFHKYVPSCSQWLCLSFSFVPKNPPFLFAECPKSSGPSAAYSEDS